MKHLRFWLVFSAAVLLVYGISAYAFVRTHAQIGRLSPGTFTTVYLAVPDTWTNRTFVFVFTPALYVLTGSIDVVWI